MEAGTPASRGATGQVGHRPPRRETPAEPGLTSQRPARARRPGSRSGRRPRADPAPRPAAPVARRACPRPASPRRTASPSTERCRAAYSVRIRSQAARSWSPRPSGRLARSVGPASSKRSHGRVGWTASGSTARSTPAARRTSSSGPSYAGPGPVALNQTGAAVGRDAHRRRPRPHVRLLDRARDPAAEPRQLARDPRLDRCPPGRVEPRPDPGRDRLAILPGCRVSGPCRRRTGSRRRRG